MTRRTRPGICNEWGDQFFQIDKRALFFYRDFDQAGQRDGTCTTLMLSSPSTVDAARPGSGSYCPGTGTDGRHPPPMGVSTGYTTSLIIILQPLFPFVAAFFDGFDLRSAGFFQILRASVRICFPVSSAHGPPGEIIRTCSRTVSPEGSLLVAAVFILIPQSGDPDHEKPHPGWRR